MDYEIAVPTAEQEEELDDELMAYNLSCVPPTQEEPFVPICRCATAQDGSLIGGVLAYSALWHVLQIRTVWVRQECRKKGLGSALLCQVEREAYRLGCRMAQLDTYDFQAREFYEKCGYTVFGTLPDAPEGHAHYYLSKRLVKDDKFPA